MKLACNLQAVYDGRWLIRKGRDMFEQWLKGAIRTQHALGKGTALEQAVAAFMHAQCIARAIGEASR